MNKKLLLLFLVFSGFTFAQMFSTGTQVLQDNVSVNIETDATTTTLTLTGPSGAWFAVGFGGKTMASGADVLRTDGTSIVDAHTSNYVLPPADTNQNWTLVSNTVSGDVRTIIATRSNNTGDSDDYTFSNSAGSIDVIWAFGTSTTYSNHSVYRRGATTLGVTLNTKEFETLNFGLYPNPISEVMNIQLPQDIDEADIGLYDFSGRLVKEARISPIEKTLNLKDVGSGMYVLKIKSDNKLGVKRIIKK